MTQTMSPAFQTVVEQLHEKYERLLAAAPYEKGMRLPTKGVYLFSKDDKALYVGRSNNIPKRYHNHRNGTKNQAAFAMCLVRERPDFKRTYAPGAKERAADPAFLEELHKAQERIRAMDFRAVEEPNQIRQTLLEIYCAVTLDTLYNKFGTH